MPWESRAESAAENPAAVPRMDWRGRQVPPHSRGCGRNVFCALKG